MSQIMLPVSKLQEVDTSVVSTSKVFTTRISHFMLIFYTALSQNTFCIIGYSGPPAVYHSYKSGILTLPDVYVPQHCLTEIIKAFTLNDDNNILNCLTCKWPNPANFDFN